MEKLFISYTTHEVVAIEIDMEPDLYYGKIREMYEQEYEQVIATTGVLDGFLKEVLLKKGKIKSVLLHQSKPLDIDPSYEPPKLSFIARLMGKKHDPEEEKAHHEHYAQKEKGLARYVQIKQEELDISVPLVNEEPRLLKKLILETALEVDIRNVTVLLNGLTLTVSGNGTFHTNSNELKEMLIQHARSEF